MLPTQNFFIPKNITSKFQGPTSKTVGEDRFKVDFWGITIKVLARNLIVCIFEISKRDPSARNNILSF